MWTISFAVIKLSLITLLGFFFYKRRIITEDILKFLTFFVISISIPALIFSHLIENSRAVLNAPLNIFIILSVGIFFAGYSLGFIFSFRGNFEFKREFISLTSFQNAGYLPMNIAFFLFPAAIRDRFLVYIFLYLIGFNVIMWSIGSFFIFKKKGDKFQFKSLMTPPVVSTVVSLLLIYTGISKFVPLMLIEPVRMVGDVSFVFSMIVLGCWLSKVKFEGVSKSLRFVAQASIVKLIILPTLFLIGLLYFKEVSLLGVFIILQAAMPSAASLPIVVNFREANSGFVSQGVFVTHLFSIITIPIWLGIYLKLSNFSF